MVGSNQVLPIVMGPDALLNIRIITNVSVALSQIERRVRHTSHIRGRD